MIALNFFILPLVYKNFYSIIRSKAVQMIAWRELQDHSAWR